MLAVLLLLAAVTVTAEDAPPGHRSIAGRLLVATEAMRDPRFARTVLYMVRHDAGGAFGLVVNLPGNRVPYERALSPFGLDVPPDSGDVQVYYGGPVDERRAFVLHTPDWRTEGTTVVEDGLAITEDPRALQAVARGTGPRRALFILGHAGWGPGQLDAELTTGAWAVAVADERIVFDEDPKHKWIEAMTRRLLSL